MIVREDGDCKIVSDRVLPKTPLIAQQAAALRLTR
jgi:hypothetical protein